MKEMGMTLAEAVVVIGGEEKAVGLLKRHVERIEEKKAKAALWKEFLKQYKAK